MATPTSKRRPRKPPEPLDWRELASGPALRGLTDVLATPADVARDRAARRIALEDDREPIAASNGPEPHTVSDTPPVVDSPTEAVPPTVQFPALSLLDESASEGLSPSVGISSISNDSYNIYVPPTDHASPPVGDTTTPHVTPAVCITPSIHNQPTSPPSPYWIDATGALHEGRRIHRVSIAQHSMTLGEERFYHAVWQAKESDGVTRESGKSKVFSLGYDRLARMVRLDEKSVRLLIPKLVSKKILEVLAAEVSASRIGRTYRIFSYEEILDRQRAANLQFIVKKGRAVEFVFPHGGATPTVGVSPSVALSPVFIALQEFGIPDDDAVSAIIAKCRRNDPAATMEEIVHFIREKGKIARSGKIANPIAFLIV